MELSPLILKWVTFLLRWGHVFFAITWIGNSFLFNYLDNKLKKNFGWEPKINPKIGINQLMNWVDNNKRLIIKALK